MTTGRANSLQTDNEDIELKLLGSSINTKESKKPAPVRIAVKAMGKKILGCYDLSLSVKIRVIQSMAFLPFLRI